MCPQPLPNTSQFAFLMDLDRTAQLVDEGVHSMKTVQLNTPSSVYIQWAEADDRRRHYLSLFIDGWPVAFSYCIAWLEGESLEEAIDLEQLESGSSAGWYVLDDCGDVHSAQALKSLEGSGPLDRLAFQELRAKLHVLSDIGEPPSKPLQEFYLAGELYQGKHRFRAEDCCGGVLINPVLPDAFDDTPNDARHQSDIEDWWGRPFIVTHTLEQRLEDYSDYEARCRRDGWKPSRTADEWEAQQENIRQQWKQHYPSGTAYTVHCLDGGAWDRSTWWGDADSLDAALVIARTGPSWRRMRGGLINDS